METPNTVSQVLTEAVSLLHRSSTKHLDSELLLAHTLGMNREQIIFQSELLLTIDQKSTFFKLLLERRDGKSIAQILGVKEFWGNDFIVSNHTLVPRPDSETIISTVLKLYPNKKSVFRIADFGTGTGCLIISILLEYVNSYGLAYEKSKLAYNTARANVIKHTLTARLKCILKSWERCSRLVDIIISNPPYINKHEIDSLPTAISKYEPRSALDGGNNGLVCYQSVMRIAKSCLRKQGYLLLEVGNKSQLLQVKKIAPQYRLQFHSTYPDLSGAMRCIAFRKI